MTAQAFNALEQEIPGVYLIKSLVHEDARGNFVKPYSLNSEILASLDFVVKEIYFSVSRKGVIRGMHFQIPPMDHAKLVFVTKGRITDVLLDLRTSSPTYLQHRSFSITERRALYVPVGVAHGFLSEADETTVLYAQSSTHSKDHDRGILWNSFGFQWGVKQPEISERDRSHPPLNDFQSPFV